MSEALRLADALGIVSVGGPLTVTMHEAAAELRRLHAELERKSDAIQRLWKERDELRSECRTLVRQNGEWQELLLKLSHAYLRGAEINTPDGCNPINPDQLARQINLHLNDQSTQEQTHDQDQRDPAGAANKTSL